jgi:LuxR family maltose regulon positive regulatory protein
MAMPVLATKLFIPRLRPGAVPRPASSSVCASLHSGRGAHLRPAGFGETAAQWIADARRRDPQVRVGWLSLDRHNDPSRFLTYLVSALQQATSAISSDAPASTLARSNRY